MSAKIPSLHSMYLLTIKERLQCNIKETPSFIENYSIKILKVSIFYKYLYNSLMFYKKRLLKWERN